MRIKQMSSYLPEMVVTNLDLEKRLDTSDEWITKRTGIKSRYVAEESIEQMAISAVKDIDIRNVDCIIVTTMSNLDVAPSLSSKVASHYGLSNCMCFDLNAACTGYVYGMITANSLLNTVDFKQVLVINCEKMSNIVDSNDRSTAILFGDAAVATLFEKTNEPSLSGVYYKSVADQNDLVCNKGEMLTMNGQSVFKFATKAICDAIESSLEKANLNVGEIDYFVFHQANKRIIDSAVRKYKLNKEKVISNIERVANTSSASVGLALSEVNLKDGDRAMLIGFGAGLAYGSVIYTHKENNEFI